MKRIPLPIRIVCLLPLILILSGGRDVAASDRQQDLFTPAGVQGADTVKEKVKDPTVIRSRRVHINLGLLSKGDKAPQKKTDINDSLTLNLFDDVVFEAILDRLEFNGSGSYTWIGHLDGIEQSQVTLVVQNEVMSGNITLSDVFYQVRYKGDGVHAIYRIDQSAFPSEKKPVSMDIPHERSFPDTTMADDGSVIDVLVVYTGAALNAAGGTTAMETLVDLAVTETNTGYSNSNITQRVNLVHTAEVSYDENVLDEDEGWSTTLYRLGWTTDGYMDDAHILRDAYSADMVVLIVNNTGSCGIGFLNSVASTAFSVVSRDCATGYYSFAHEMGHNMSARHDWYVDDTTNSPYTYNHAYVAPAKNWRTIMAYSWDCSGCTRLNYWSNPGVTYGGAPMGVAEGTSTSCSEGVPSPNCDADNHKTLNNTAYTVANFRQSAVTIVPTVTTTAASAVTGTTASSGGDVTADGGASVTARGVCWSTSANPTTSNSTTSDGTGTGAFTSAITGLSPGADYHVRAYAANSAGTGYGTDLSFSTSTCPTCSGGAVVFNGDTFPSGETCECTGATITLLNVTVPNGATANLTGTTSITVGSGTTLKSGSNCTFASPNTTFQPGSHVESGAILNVGQ